MRALCRATPAGPGVASGEIVFDPSGAQRAAAAGRSVILVRHATATEDIAGIAAAAGILTATGGRSSHAAVVARQMNKVCLVGCDALIVNPGSRRCVIAGQSFAEGDLLTLDGLSGEVLAGWAHVETERPVAQIARVEEWRARLTASTEAAAA